MDNSIDKIPFNQINRAIDELIKRLKAKNVCPCCIARGLAYRGVYLLEDTAGSEEAAELCQDVAETLGEHDEDVPERSVQH